MEAVEELRKEIQAAGLSGYIVTNSDPHHSEYLADWDKRVAFLSHFTGSYATLVVTLEQAALWTDGRYFIQAGQQLPSQITLMKMYTPGCPSVGDWLIEVLPPESLVGVDPKLCSYNEFQNWFHALEKIKCRLYCSVDNLVDRVWNDRPKFVLQPTVVHPLHYAGETANSKLSWLKSQIAADRALFITALDEVAWLLNIRGNDIPFNRLSFWYFIATSDSCVLFADKSFLHSDVLALLAESQVEISSYNEVYHFLDRVVEQKMIIMLDPDTCVAAFFEKVPQNQLLSNVSPIPMKKAVKNSTEICGFRNACLRESANLVCFLSWLESAVGIDKVSENEAVEALESIRKSRGDYFHPSFETMSCSGRNSSIIHYKPSPEHCGFISKTEIYLLDAGGQYYDGTTDTTRTVHFGQPSESEIVAFTQVLKAHIALASATFPSGTIGKDLDTICRAQVWERGMDYRHGTGHGVGSCLCVHEGPHALSGRIGESSKVGIVEGMTTTIEPGFYQDDDFGIRIENQALLIKASPPISDYGEFLGFETLTFVPIHSSLVDYALLSEKERSWVNNYNSQCLKSLSPLLEDCPEILTWLASHCKPLSAKKVKED